MRTVELDQVRCEGCGSALARKAWGSRCGGCSGGSFQVEIERSAQGLDGENFLDAMVRGPVGGGGSTLGGLLGNLIVDESGVSPYFRMQSLVTCGSVSAEEIASFLGSPLEERVRQYVAWKRREFDRAPKPDQRTCLRCGVLFKPFNNDWNRAGLCSKACHHAHALSTRKPG